MPKKNSQQHRRDQTSLIRKLVSLRRQFDTKSSREKFSLIKQLRRMPLTRAADLKEYHDLLCFVRAYPDSADIAKAAERELAAFAVRVETYKESTRDSRARHLSNTGIIGTLTTHNFGFEISRQLLEWYPTELTLDWELNEGSFNEEFDSYLQFLVAYPENDTLDNDLYLDIRDWLTIGFGASDNKRLHSLFRLFLHAPLPRPVIRYLFEKMQLELTWDLAGSQASRTLRRVSSGNTFYQTEPLKGRTRNLRAAVTSPAPPLQHQTSKSGAAYVRAVNEVLAVRNRELDPLSMANPSEVYVAPVGRGLVIVVFGMMPNDRLPLESNFGALLLRNGMPIGYGVAATLLDRVEIAINVFPAFRAGESSYIFEQFFRIFYHHFDSRVFLVRSRQMGFGEDEALYSGAFWFYYKLGFRAIDQKIRRLADKEAAKIEQRPNYRTPIATMKRLSKSDVFFHIDPDRMDTWDELSLINLGYAVTQLLAGRFKGNRKQGIARSVEKVVRLLGIKDRSRWTREELLGLERLAPLVVRLPGLTRWSSADRTALARVIRAKGSVRERSFVLASNRHPRLRAALEKLAADGPEWPD